MKLVLGVGCIISATALGWHSYQNYVSEGVSHKKALFLSLSSGVNSLVALGSIVRLFTFQPDHNPYDVNFTAQHQEPSIDINIENLPPEPPTFNIPWVLILGVGAALVAPEFLPFVFALR
ncbi:MAG: hypothetical protein HC862_02965 [Scytonema sp. RU_4_4]|nr:hypothetical protein [Scytonema sp. RU_4_4]